MCDQAHFLCSWGYSRESSQLLIFLEQQLPAFQEVTHPCASAAYRLEAVVFYKSLKHSNFNLKHVSHHKRVFLIKVGKRKTILFLFKVLPRWLPNFISSKMWYIILTQWNFKKGNFNVFYSGLHKHDYKTASWTSGGLHDRMLAQSTRPWVGSPNIEIIFTTSKKLWFH